MFIMGELVNDSYRCVSYKEKRVIEDTVLSQMNLFKTTVRNIIQKMFEMTGAQKLAPCPNMLIRSSEKLDSSNKVGP